MGKTQQQRKRKRAAAANQNQESSSKKQNSIASTSALPSPPSSSTSDATLPADHKRLDPSGSVSDAESSAIDEVDLAITLDTLSKLIETPSLLNGPTMKSLRTALHLLSSSHTNSASGDGLIATISTCLRNSDWTKALLLLDQVQEANVVIKLGTLQRWIRDCDSVAAITEDGNGNLGADYKVYIVIDKIMRTINGTSRVSSSSTRHSKDLLESVLIRHNSWSPVISEHERSETRSSSMKKLEEVSPSDFRICQNLEGEKRAPPNKYPAIIHTSREGSIPLTLLSQRSEVRSQDVPNVSGAKFLSNVFSRDECSCFIRIAEEIGMLPDEPIATTSAANLQSVLAHNFYWLADEDYMENLFQRIKPCLPEFMDGGRKLTGINSRFRLYKYTKGSVYRPHIDGAWPPSGLDPSLPEGQDYVFDVSPPQAKEWSRFTLLLYLNEGFQGGATTFFTPNPDREGVLDAWPVKPVIGCALVFPHGASEGSLVHEGSGIEKDGDAKYIIRTDILYTRDPVV